VALAAGAIPLDPSQLSAMTSTQLNASGDSQLLKAVADLGS
jgi:hypothetical protein